MASTPSSLNTLPNTTLRKLARWLANHSYADVGMAIGSTADEYKTAATANYTIDGVWYTKAATDDINFTAGHTALAASQKCLVAICLDAAGTFSSIQSSIVAASASDPDWPTIPITVVCIGGIKIETGATTFTFDTTNLSAANVTDTYYDFNGLPPTGSSAFALTV